MSVPISNVTRRVVFAPSGTGPYAFTFEVLAQTDIEVYKGDTLLTLTTDYTVTINPNGTGSVTLVATAGTDNITIIGARAIQRTTDFVTGGDFFASTVNSELDSLTIFAQQNAEGIERALRAPETDPTTINMTLPRKADRAGKYLAFDEVTGDPVPGETPAELAQTLAIADAISALATIDDEIVTVANAITAVISVDSIASETNLVGDNISAVITVALDLSGTNTIGAVAADLAGSGNISIVGNDISKVVAVGNNISGVITVANNLSGSGNINIVANNISGVNSVANNISGVISIANNISGIIDIAADLNGSGNISIVATDLDGPNTIGSAAAVAADIAIVAGIATEITAVEANETNINTVAGQITPVNNIASVAGIAANITTVANIANAISAVATIDQADLSAVAAIDSEVIAVAAVASSVSAVATIASDVTTVANNVTDITNFSDVYLGPKNTDPAVRNDSSALQAGDLYFNTVDDIIKVYTGAVWEAAYVSGGGFLATTGGTMTGDILMGAQSDIRFGDADSSNWVALQGPATVASNVTWTLPATDGSPDQLLKTDGSGTLSWATAASGISTGKAIAMAIVFG